MPILKRNKKEEKPVVASAETTSEAPVVKKTRATKAKKAASSSENTAAKMVAAQVIVRPLSTEKLARQGEGVYGFRVALTATKVSVMHAVKALHGVTPVRVNIVNVLGKKVRYGRTEGRHSDWKKAIVYLKKGDHMDVHAGV